MIRRLNDERLTQAIALWQVSVADMLERRAGHRGRKSLPRSLPQGRRDVPH
jgi:hypothetical protein